MRFLRRSLVGALLFALTAGLMLAAGQSVYSALRTVWDAETPERPERERVFAVNVVTVELATVTPVLETFGEVRSRRTLELRAGTGGRIVELAEDFEEGGAVEAGELLVRIDPADAEAARSVAFADLSEAEAELEDAERALGLARDDVAAAEAQNALRERALARQQDLAARGVGTEAAVETAELAAAASAQAVLSRRQALATAEARRAQAETGLERARIALAEAERRVDDTELRASFGGVLSGVTLVEGGLVSEGERLAGLVDPEALEVTFRVSTAQYARLLDSEGRLVRAPITVSIDVEGVDLAASGRITRESAVVEAGQTGRLLFAALDRAAGFRPGDFVTVRIEEPALEGVALVPATAVGADGAVLALGADERLELAEAEVLRRQGDDVILRAGDLAGREIVAARTPLLGSGIQVRPIRPGGEAAARPEVPEMVALDEARRARLVAFVEGNQFMPAEAKARVLAQLREPEVPVQVVTRIEERMGG